MILRRDNDGNQINLAEKFAIICESGRAYLGRYLFSPFTADISDPDEIYILQCGIFLGVKPAQIANPDHTSAQTAHL
jgi:hypothetical protein